MSDECWRGRCARASQASCGWVGEWVGKGWVSEVKVSEKGERGGEGGGVGVRGWEGDGGWCPFPTPCSSFARQTSSPPPPPPFQGGPSPRPDIYGLACQPALTDDPPHVRPSPSLLPPRPPRTRILRRPSRKGRGPKEGRGEVVVIDRDCPPTQSRPDLAAHTRPPTGRPASSAPASQTASQATACHATPQPPATEGRSPTSVVGAVVLVIVSRGRAVPRLSPRPPARGERADGVCVADPPSLPPPGWRCA